MHALQERPVVYRHGVGGSRVEACERHVVWRLLWGLVGRVV